MTNKRKTAYELIIVGLSIILLALCAYMGITAVQKSMRLNISFSSTPSIKVLIQIEDPQADGGYRTIFRNDANTQIGDGLRISGNTLSFTESFANSEPNIGESFVLKFTNLMTNSGLKVSEVGSSASADPTYVTMKASGTGLNTATMTISGSEVSTLQLMFSEYNTYTVSFSGPSVSNATSEAGSGDGYSTTLTPKEGYNIPSSVSITVGGVAIDSNSYTYTPSTGALTINAGVVNGDVVITATATAKSYTITYNLAGGTNHASNPATYTVEDTITLQAPTRLFYEFTGWTESNGSTPETSVTIPQGSTGNKAYTANWTLGNYTLMKGQNLNAKIKQTANTSTSDSTVKSIIFGKYSTYASTVGTWTGGIAVDIDGDEDGNADGYIRMFLTNSNANCYILSDGNIYANADASSMFVQFRGVTSITFDNFNTSNVTDMNKMFNYCTSLTELDLRSFNTSNVTNMNKMLYICSKLTSITFPRNFGSAATDMSDMFSNCTSLTSLNVSNFDTSNVTDMGSMFFACSVLQTLNLGNFNTKKVTDMSFMFSYCPKLTSLDLSNFNTSNVTNMTQMFSEGSSLTSLDLSNFNTSNVTNMNYMFYGCSGLTTIKTKYASSTAFAGSADATNWLSNCPATWVQVS